jgi:hypothetical protein
VEAKKMVQLEAQKDKQERRTLARRKAIGERDQRYIKERNKLDMIRAEYKRVQNRASTRAARA